MNDLNWADRQYILGKLDERQRVIEILEAERNWVAEEITFPPNADTHNAFVYAQLISGLVALIKGDNNVE